MSKKKLARIRRSAFEQQGGRCYYCRRPMWRSEPDKYAERYGLTRKQASLFQCTAEHLFARRDGGRDEFQNIVAACRFCNRRRHARGAALSPERYKNLVSERLRKHRWQGRGILIRLANGEADQMPG
jgi:5-methylcytosine-specific restriction endonuclease McrA